MKKLAIIAGSGSLPIVLAQSAEEQGWDVYALCLKGHANNADFQSFHFETFRVAQGGAMIRSMRRRGITHVALAGGIRRPTLSEARPDWWTLKFLLRYGVTALGDDGALKAVRLALEKEGFQISGVQDFLPELLVPYGPIAGRVPDQNAEHDIEKGKSVCQAIGFLDIGQACVIQQGLVLGVEAIEGTDALIKRCADYKRTGAGPILVKCAKPGQDNMLDLPTIGPSTILHAIEAGFSGIAIQARTALIIDVDAVRSLAEKHRIFVVGL